MKCFVIMPYGSRNANDPQRRDLDTLYEHLIKPAVEAVSIPGHPGHVLCHRGDKEPRPGEIITHIIDNLVSSEIAIADLSGRNPNVFYELGVRHAVSNNTVLISSAEDDIPFDLRGLRFIIYERDFHGAVRLRNAITAAVSDIVREPLKIDNPVRRFIYEKEKHAIQEQGGSYDARKDLLAEIISLRSELKTQLDEVRSIAHAVTASRWPTETPSATPNDLGFLDGIWNAYPSGSLVCVRYIDGNLLAPYCYGSDTELTGHYHSFRRIGDSLFARFEWFKHPDVRGYARLVIESVDKLAGGWWFEDSVPDWARKDVTRIDQTLPGMERITLERASESKTPWWAQKYFKELDNKKNR